MSVSDLIASLEDIVGKMKYVADGEYVLAEHTNLFVDYTTTALQLLKQLYELFKAKTGKTLPNTEQWINMAETRTSYMRKVAYGDIVLSRDHNLIVDTLKCVEVSLYEIEKNL